MSLNWMGIIKILLKVASNESEIFCRKLLQIEREQIDFAKNHSLYMN